MFSSDTRKNNKIWIKITKFSRTATIIVHPDDTANGDDWQSIYEYIEGSFDVDRHLIGHGSGAYQYSSDSMLYS